MGMWEVRPEEKIKEITGKITFADDEVVEFRMDYDTGTQRWGNTVEVLGRAVLPTDEMTEAISGEELWYDPDEDDENEEDPDGN